MSQDVTASEPFQDAMPDRDSLCERLPGLLLKAAAVGANGLGVLRLEGADRVVLTYASPHGASAHRRQHGQPALGIRRGRCERRWLIQPPWTGERRLSAAQLGERRSAGCERPALMMTGLQHDTALDAKQTAAVAAIAGDLVTEPSESTTAELAWLRRLASADVLLPALFQVLDIRDIFDTVSRSRRN